MHRNLPERCLDLLLGALWKTQGAWTWLRSMIQSITYLLGSGSIALRMARARNNPQQITLLTELWYGLRKANHP